VLSETCAAFLLPRESGNLANHFERIGGVMKTNPLLDSLEYVIHAGTWTTALFDILLLAGIAIVIIVWRHRPEQRTASHVWVLIARTVVGAMWWQQTIWKTPPTYGGLRFWMEQMAKYASSDLQRHVVSDIVLAHYAFFAPQVYMAEVLISVCLLLGVWSRLGGLVGSAMALNLMFGLYRSPSEWVWTYVFLVILMVQFAVQPPGRSLGLDALLRSTPGQQLSWRGRLLRWVR
jgi:uncharacterized membrane protein YphA (DoxX/SURF4 family)